MRILLVEDNQLTREIVVRELQFLGYQVTAVENGMDAVAHAIATIPDLIIMDIQMPVMDGPQAVVEIRKKPTSLIPILAATAKALPTDKERCVAAGCDGYIAKPFTHVEL